MVPKRVSSKSESKVNRLGTQALASLAFSALLCVSTASVADAVGPIPGRRLVEAPLVDVDTARSVLSAGQAGLAAAAAGGFAAAASTAVSPEITELARGLENDVDLIFQFVYEQIEYIPIYGSLKGATATLLERQGNDFDQASLLVALLRAAGHTATFVRGTIRVDPAAVTSWPG